MKETEIAKILIDWLSSDFEVFQEVPVGNYGTRRIIDVVAVDKGRKFAWAIEVKNSFNNTLLWQAESNLRQSPYVSVAVLKTKKPTKPRLKWIEKFTKAGIGILYIDPCGIVEQVTGIQSALNQRRFDLYKRDERYENLLNLPPELKTYCSAGSQGGYLTPFKITCNNIVEYVREHPGCTMLEAVRNIDHHYSSDNAAASALTKWGIKGIQAKWCLFPKE